MSNETRTYRTLLVDFLERDRSSATAPSAPSAAAVASRSEFRSDAIRCEPIGRVVQITLNRPERRNAMGPTMVNELRWALADAAADDTVRVVVLTGKGNAFCAGGDFSQMSAGDGADLPAFPGGGGDFAALLLCMSQFGKPLVAKVNGHAMGGGLGLVAASTFAIASTSAQLGTPEVDVGLFPMMIMALLVRLVPRRRLVSMMLLGTRIEAHEACELGLVSEVVLPEELDAAVLTLCDRLRTKAPLAVKQGLEALYAQDAQTLDEALPMLRDRLSALLATDDAREGLTAFLEKRPPQWRGL
ncbi:MAG: enoyl-CoA hydratase-related protein [Polyangiales bacterium]